MYYSANTSALNRLKVVLSANTVTPAAGSSLDANSAANAQLFIGTTDPITSNSLLAIITLQRPSFTFANRTATLAGVPLTTEASNSGIATTGNLLDCANNLIIGGLTVGTANTDIIITNTSVNLGDTVTCTAGSFTG